VFGVVLVVRAYFGWVFLYAVWSSLRPWKWDRYRRVRSWLMEVELWDVVATRWFWFLVVWLMLNGLLWLVVVL